MALTADSLDAELDAVFYDCPKDEFGNARTSDLIDNCVAKYAGGQPEFKDMLKLKMDSDGSNPFISRSLFKRHIKNWMSSVSGNTSEEYSLSSDEGALDGQAFEPEYLHSVPCSTPLKSSSHAISQRRLLLSQLDSSTYDSCMTFHLQQSRREEVSVLKERNDSLERSLMKAEQKVSSLETKFQKQKIEMNKKIESVESENLRLTALLLDLQDKCKELESANDKYKSCNEKLTADAEKTKQLEKAYDDLEINLYRTSELLESRSSDLKDMEMLLQHVQLELGQTRESRDEIEKSLHSLKLELEIAYINQKELTNRNAELVTEKQELQRELADAKALEQLTFSSYFLHSDQQDGIFQGPVHNEDQRESGISIKSELSDAMVMCPGSRILHNSGSSSRSNRASPDISPDTYNQSNSLRSPCLEVRMQTDSIQETRVSCVHTSMQTDFSENLKISTVAMGIQTDSTQKVRVALVHTGLQTDAIKKVRFNSKEVQTTGELSNKSPSRFDSKEVQTIDEKSIKSLHRFDSKESQTTSEIMKKSLSIFDSGESLTSKELSNISLYSFRCFGGDGVTNRLRRLQYWHFNLIAVIHHPWNWLHPLQQLINYIYVKTYS